ncbi:MAG: translesion error-prone DNA polymerase V autoproteolytic subunit [Rubricoccaceae bacterium]|nr:translesion error-prone DNA polymerase V autoproteolytic subunit [Rubricoccaceae bacterium]
MPPVLVPLFLCRVPCGFPSPADDYVDRLLDLNELCVRNRAATFFLRAEGESMRDAGIHPGDVLVVDRSAEPRSGHVVVAVLDGALTVKQLRVDTTEGRRRLRLVSCSPEPATIEVAPEQDFEVWGVVTHVVHPLG